MSFSQDFHSRNIPLWTELLAEFKGKPATYCEVGLFEGLSMCWVMENILTDPNARAYGIDTFKGSDGIRECVVIDGVTLEQRYRENIKPYEDKIVTHVGESRVILGSWQQNRDPYLDFVFVDGNHDADACYLDMALVWPLLKPKGIMIVDDRIWLNPDFPNDPLKTPFLGIESWLALHKGKYDLLHLEAQAIVRKK